MKVTYTTTTGAMSTAYLDDEWADADRATGTDKYTDQPVSLLWSGHQWMEAPNG
jgi:hypothetical protein